MPSEEQNAHELATSQMLATEVIKLLNQLRFYAMYTRDAADIAEAIVHNHNIRPSVRLGLDWMDEQLELD